jgi:hypothetical protein
LSNGGDAGRPRVDGGRASAAMLRTLVSADRAKLEGMGQTEGCPGLWVIRRSLPRQRTRRGLDGDRRTGARPQRAVVELPGRACGARRVLWAASA